MTTERLENRPCFKCIHRGSVPGDVHIYCKAAFDPNANPFAGVLAILGSVGRVPLPGPTKEVGFTPERKVWPGSGSWPANFDALTVTSCQGFEEAQP